MKFIYTLAALAFMLSSRLLLADEIDVLALKSSQQALDQFILLEQKAQQMTIQPSSVAPGCLAMPLPTTPKTPNFTATYKWLNGDSAKLTFWREPCVTGTAKALLFTATPIIGTPFLCGVNFQVIQNGTQYTDINFQDGSGPTGGFCGSLIVSKTFVFDQKVLSPLQFNPANALSIYSGISSLTKLIDIPVNGTTPSRVSGTANGYKSFNHTCQNVTTGATKTFPAQTAPGFNCNGLVMKKGNTVKTTISGVVN